MKGFIHARTQEAALVLYSMGRDVCPRVQSGVQPCVARLVCVCGVSRIRPYGPRVARVN